ncbi:hypothetical protein VTN77DRAFT_9451 [Rasamsonia byssochlamydoides]|uniref:uncharacterized protein n=1 Tax=Rasamsonia byssochlamydoides TaxID=89139 RepID=UPI0037438B7A
MWRARRILGRWAAGLAWARPSGSYGVLINQVESSNLRFLQGGDSFKYLGTPYYSVLVLRNVALPIRGVLGKGVQAKATGLRSPEGRCLSKFKRSGRSFSTACSGRAPSPCSDASLVAGTAARFEVQESCIHSRRTCSTDQ